MVLSCFPSVHLAVEELENFVVYFLLHQVPQNLHHNHTNSNTNFTICELLFANNKFKKQFNSLTNLSPNPDAPKCQELVNLGANIVPRKPGRMKEVVATLKQTEADTICPIPPAHQSKFDIAVELIEAQRPAYPMCCSLVPLGVIWRSGSSRHS